MYQIKLIDIEKSNISKNSKKSNALNKTNRYGRRIIP